MFFQLLKPDDARWSPPARRELTSTLDLRRPSRQTKVVTVNLGAFESQTHPPRRLHVAFSRGSGFSSVWVVVHDIEGVQGTHDDGGVYTPNIVDKSFLIKPQDGDCEHVSEPTHEVSDGQKVSPSSLEEPAEESDMGVGVLFCWLWYSIVGPSGM